MKKGHQCRGRLYGRGGPVVGLGSDKSVGQRSSGGLRPLIDASFHGLMLGHGNGESSPPDPGLSRPEG